jgi:hypothetical protein
MRRVSTLTIAWALFSATASAQPADVSQAMPEGLRTHVRAETFTPVPSVAALPEGVKSELARLFGMKTLHLAEPGAPFQATDVVSTPLLPWRRLVSAGCAADHCLVHYERGGFVHAYEAVVLSRQGETVRFVWGARVPSAIPDIPTVRNFLSSGQVSGHAKPW